jgi:hypothetical protein
VLRMRRAVVWRYCQGGNMHKPRPTRTRYLKKPRRYLEDEDHGDEPEDPINGPGETQEGK